MPRYPLIFIHSCWKEGNVLFNALFTEITREETRWRHMGYSFQLAARFILYYRQDRTYHGLCYTSRGTLAGTWNSSMGPPWRIDPTTHRTMSERSYHGATSRSRSWWKTAYLPPKRRTYGRVVPFGYGLSWCREEVTPQITANGNTTVRLYVDGILRPSVLPFVVSFVSMTTPNSIQPESCCDGLHSRQTCPNLSQGMSRKVVLNNIHTPQSTKRIDSGPSENGYVSYVTSSDNWHRLWIGVFARGGHTLLIFLVIQHEWFFVCSLLLLFIIIIIIVIIIIMIVIIIFLLMMMMIIIIILFYFYVCIYLFIYFGNWFNEHSPKSNI